MSLFLRLLDISEKEKSLLEICAGVRQGSAGPRQYEVAPESFDSVPGKPFAYWVSDNVLSLFRKLPEFEDDSKHRVARRGVNSNDDHRFLRCKWEVKSPRWVNHPKGGAFSQFYADTYLVLDWLNSGAYLEVERNTSKVYTFAIVPSKDLYFRAGLTWTRRTQGGLGLRAMPAGCIFADKGPAILVDGDNPDELLALLALVNSHAFGLLVSLQMAFGSYEVGVIQRTPMPALTFLQQKRLAALARRAWSLKRALDTTNEISFAFVLPLMVRAQRCDYTPTDIQAELVSIQAEIDEMAFGIYGFSEIDRQAALSKSGIEAASGTDAEPDEEEGQGSDVAATDALLSWAVGVAFGRFDVSLATGERVAPTEPEPFDPLPAKSPGMLPDGKIPFHRHAGILVEDQGHPHDLAHLIQEVLTKSNASESADFRGWLRRDFFAFHLQHYSKSRRKAPIYWPIATTSGSYTLWIYYPDINGQTLYAAINDFIEPKLRRIVVDVAELRNIGATRSYDEEEKFEKLQAFELELIELRDTLLMIAPTYMPSHDDGVQISAAPLWPVFRYKPWQKVLKETWTKLENGDYDWAQLALNYWPGRVREKCKTDKSLAVAHGLEALYIELAAKPKVRGKKPAE